MVGLAMFAVALAAFVLTQVASVVYSYRVALTFVALACLCAFVAPPSFLPANLPVMTTTTTTTTTTTSHSLFQGIRVESTATFQTQLRIPSASTAAATLESVRGALEAASVPPSLAARLATAATAHEAPADMLLEEHFMTAEGLACVFSAAWGAPVHASAGGVGGAIGVSGGAGGKTHENSVTSLAPAALPLSLSLAGACVVRAQERVGTKTSREYKPTGGVESTCVYKGFFCTKTTQVAMHETTVDVMGRPPLTLPEYEVVVADLTQLLGEKGRGGGLGRAGEVPLLAAE